MAKFGPDWGVHPGEILQDELIVRGMSQSELAKRMGRSAKHVNQICRGKVGLSAQVAIELEMVLGIPARTWLHLDADYRLYLALRRGT